MRPAAVADEPRPGAREFIDFVLDPGTFASWDLPVAEPADASLAYRAGLARARQTAGTDEAVLTGRGELGGRPVAVVVSEFRFLGGTVGVACAERIEAAVRRATAERLPLLAAPASGGTRMQEGTVAFVQMIAITGAVMAHRQAGLPYIVYLRHPTMGGVFASWGSLGHLMLAEPRALLGFIGPKVYAALHGAPFPGGIQTAENLARNGVIDAVVTPARLREFASRALRLTARPSGAQARGDTDAPSGSGAAAAAAEPWQAIQQTRDPARPGLREVLRLAASDQVPLSGSADGAHPGLVTALAGIGGTPCAVIGHDRDGQRDHGPLGPAALRQVRRCIQLAAELRLPLVTFIDMPGMALSREAEEGGLSAEIACCLAELLALPSPTVAVLLGEGAGGGALALLPADRILAVADGWLAPLPPEGSSAILHNGDTSLAAELAGTQGVSAGRLAADGIVDTIVPGPAGDTPAFARGLASAVARELRMARSVPQARRLVARTERFRTMPAGGLGQQP